MLVQKNTKFWVLSEEFSNLVQRLLETSRYVTRPHSRPRSRSAESPLDDSDSVGSIGHPVISVPGRLATLTRRPRTFVWWIAIRSRGFRVRLGAVPALPLLIWWAYGQCAPALSKRSVMSTAVPTNRR